MERTQGELPEVVERVLQDFAAATQVAFGPDLIAIVVYGSAAEGRLRPTSDVNAIVVLSGFDPARADRLREPLRTAHAAIGLDAMLLLEGEIPAAVEAFAVKFADIAHRRRLLYGRDPFEGLRPSRAAEIARLEQVLLNLTLRLRERYVMQSLRDEQAARVVADASGPLRACAAALLELRGVPADSPKAALERLAAELPGADFRDVVRQLSAAREQTLAPGAAAPLLLRMIELTRALRAQLPAP
jgi:predicted nucleotidyltransferase